MRYDYNKLKTFGAHVMVKAGLEQEEAELFMENLLYADSRGIGSHGISRLINYSKRVKCGVIAGGVDIKVVQEAPASLVCRLLWEHQAHQPAWMAKLPDKTDTQNSCFS